MTAGLPSQSLDCLTLASDIVASYVTHNSVPQADLGELIIAVHKALLQVSSNQPVEETPTPPKPPVPVGRTVRPDYIVSLEDGRQYRSLKRHLRARGLTPEAYRAKWGLRPDYPMVAPNYSKVRSDLAKAAGLGQKTTARKRKARKPSA
ncbi:MAG TPA: MucR family transcriptional regulator [Beijerinckiaceae bacterium]|jgi:predicted transcriptional regulator